MEGIEGADPQGGAVPTRQIDAGLPCAGREFGEEPSTAGAILLKIKPSSPCDEWVQLAAKDVLMNRMGHFRSVQGSGKNLGTKLHAAHDLSRMSVLNVT